MTDDERYSVEAVTARYTETLQQRTQSSLDAVRGIAALLPYDALEAGDNPGSVLPLVMLTYYVGLVAKIEQVVMETTSPLLSFEQFRKQVDLMRDLVVTELAQELAKQQQADGNAPTAS